MEENVALDSTKQKQFVKSIKGIKNLINKKEKVDGDDDVKVKTKKPGKRARQTGLVYLSHIPHGFYEHEMTQYFKQFGVVTNARVIRSKRTGNSKGFAFVEFKDASVGEIVAETMNNYLMGKRLIKAVYIPPEKQHHKVFRKNWNEHNNPGRTQKLQMKRSYNSEKVDDQDVAIARKLLKNVEKTKKQLNEMGINYDFFTPVDAPASLQVEESAKSEPKKIIAKQKNKKITKSKDTIDSKIVVKVKKIIKKKK